MSKSYHVTSNPVACLTDRSSQSEGDCFEIYGEFRTAEAAIAAARREVVAQLKNGKRGFSWMRDHDDDAVVVYEYGIAYNRFEVEAWDDEDAEAEPETISLVDAIELSDMLGSLVRDTPYDGSYWDHICWDSEVVDEGVGMQLINWRGMWGDLQCLRTVSVSSEILLPDFTNGERYATVAEALELGTWSHSWEAPEVDSPLMYTMLEELITC
jgi:hypothetical protein